MSWCSWVIADLIAKISVLVYLWLYKPWIIVKYSQNLLLWLTGCRTKCISLDDGLTLSYAERGSVMPGKSTLVLLHGYTLSKELWTAVIFNLPKDFCHVILIDLPGHGDSTTPDGAIEQSVDYYVDSVHKLLCKIGLQNLPVHIAGMSMGGLITGMYAVKHPKHVKQVSIMCPAMSSPKKTAYVEQFLLGKNTLLAKDNESLYATLKILVFNTKMIPENDQFLTGVLKTRVDSHPYYTRVFNDMLFKEEVTTMLEKNVHKIKTPSHVIWGSDDQLLDVSGADVLQKNLGNCVQTDIISDCGHLLAPEHPRHLANCLIAYRQAT